MSALLAIAAGCQVVELLRRRSAERRPLLGLGLPLATCAEQAVITPACGLAGVSPGHARAALARCREAAGMLAELIEETGGEPG